MERRIVSSLRGCTLVVCLLSLIPRPVSATVVFDDHFTGNSNGVPAEWMNLLGTGTAIEWGTVVELYGRIVIGSYSVVDPTAGTVNLVLDIAGVAGAGMAGAGFFTLKCSFWILIRATDGRISAVAANSDVGQQHHIVGYLSGYTGAPIRVTLETGSTAFRIFTDSPSFDSGSIQYAAVFPAFTRADLGEAAGVCLWNNLDSGEMGSSSIDRVTVDVVPQVPVEGRTFGRVKALYRR